MVSCMLLTMDNTIVNLSSMTSTIILDWLQSPVAVVLFSLIIPVLTWLFSPEYLQQAIKQFFSQNKIDVNELGSNITKLKLGVFNERQLLMDKFVHSYNYVFFPVVPNKSPNIIHVTFINAIKGLESLGLYVCVFVYDDYFARVKGYSVEQRKLYISNFTRRLQDMGIRKSQIIYESKINRSNANTKKMLKCFLDISSKLTIDEIDSLSVINNHYVGADTKYIRKFKSLLNLIYPKCISSKIGFVLSGEDEKRLWEMYVHNIDNDIVHLFIPSLYKNDALLGNILDEDNLSYEDSIESLNVKIKKVLVEQRPYNKRSNIFYLLDLNFFAFNKVIEFDNGEGNLTKISDIEKLIEYCNSQGIAGDIPEGIIDILSQTVYFIFHIKKGEEHR